MGMVSETRPTNGGAADRRGGEPAGARRARAGVRAAGPDRRRWRVRLARVSIHLVLATFCLAVVLPLLWVLVLSMKTLPDAASNFPLPRDGLDFSHYAYAWERVPTLPRNMLNSIFVSLATVVIVCACSVLAGYALVHLPTPGKALLLGVFVTSLFFPVRITGLIGVWEVQRHLGLLNTTHGLVFAYAGALPALALGVFMMRGVFQTIPRELGQAAYVDGAGPWQTFWYIMLPLVRNGLIVVALFTFVLAWGEYLLAATLTNDVEVRTMPIIIASATGGIGQWAWPRIAAVYVSTIAPAFVLFALLHNRIMDGIQEGALKE